MQKGSLPFAIREQSFHPDLRIRRYQPAERSHVKQFPSRSFGLAITILSVSHLLHNTTSHTRILGRRQFLTRHHTPTNLLSGQATWLRCRVLDEPLANTLVSKLGLQHRHAALSTGSSVSLVDGNPMLVVCSLTLRLFTDRMPSSCRCSVFFA
jgi:hypothetical protein